MIYFDHNATSALSDTARNSWVAAAKTHVANASSPHRLGTRAEVALSGARQTAAGFLGCSEFDLVWTSGATEGNNAIFHHASKNSKGQAWISSIEHPSAIAATQRSFGKRVRLLKVTSDGIVDLNFLKDQLKQQRPAIVSIMAANNETGVLQPWREALELCREFGAPFACDAAQWIGKELSGGLGECDFVTGCAHKFGGPLGIGILKVPKSFQPLLVGGPQEDGRRAGTENLPGALSMVAAWTEREESIKKGEVQTRRRWRDEFITNLKRELPDIQIVGERSPRLWNTVAAVMPETSDCRRRWVVQLDKAGFAVSTGSACSSGKQKPSHVLMAMGYDAAKSDRMLRFSAGWETTKENWMRLLDAIKAAHWELAGNRI